MSDNCVILEMSKDNKKAALVHGIVQHLKSHFKFNVQFEEKTEGNNILFTISFDEPKAYYIFGRFIENQKVLSLGE
ncbi:MAG TPA: hypothetical protein VK590_11530 [Saprospiraceae bacterium]|nr:hypothetical protein [Saprospiraceae bacterium]